MTDKEISFCIGVLLGLLGNCLGSLVYAELRA